MSVPDSPNPKILKLTKLDLARRQLHTAITLWFTNGDPVSIYTLAAAAYEIIHTVTKKRIPNRRTLLFDGNSLTDDGRKVIKITLKNIASFFKHADRGPDAILDFDPWISEALIFYSIIGIRTYDNLPNTIEYAFMIYLDLHRPQYLSDEERKLIEDSIPVQALEKIKSFSKKDFFEFHQTRFAEFVADNDNST